MNIKDKVIVVTGAAQGLGQQIANRLGNYRLRTETAAIAVAAIANIQ